MAEIKTPAKQGWFMKLLNWFKCLPGRIAQAFKNMVAELRKVTWPSKKRLISSTITVLVFMLFMGIVIGLLDSASFTAVNALSDVLRVEEQGTVPSDDVELPVEGVEAPAEGAEAPVEGVEAPVEGAEVTGETTEAPAEPQAE